MRRLGLVNHLKARHPGCPRHVHTKFLSHTFSEHLRETFQPTAPRCTKAPSALAYVEDELACGSTLGWKLIDGKHGDASMRGLSLVSGCLHLLALALLAVACSCHCQSHGKHLPWATQTSFRIFCDTLGGSARCEFCNSMQQNPLKCHSDTCRVHRGIDLTHTSSTD